MKKALFIFLALIVVVAASLFLLWSFRVTIASHYLSKALNGAPVSISALDYKDSTLTVDGLHIGNPRGSKTSTAFKADTLSIEASLKDLRGETLTIEEIDLTNILIGVEFYNATKTDSNWSRILNRKTSKDKGSKRHYLIKKLTLRNLTIMTTDSNGKVTRYPTLKKMEFYNISDETGFPIEEIEKAIFNIILKRALQEFGIKAMETLQRFVPQVPNLPFLGR